MFCGVLRGPTLHHKAAYVAFLSDSMQNVESHGGSVTNGENAVESSASNGT